MFRYTKKTVTNFLRHPDKLQWYGEMSKHGWRGPNGSSWSFDDIMGIRIGNSDPHYDHSFLPANRHDWLYQIGRRYGLPEEFRKAADLDYLFLCNDRTRVLVGWRGVIARRIAGGRYAGLRMFGRWAWRHA